MLDRMLILLMLPAIHGSLISLTQREVGDPSASVRNLFILLLMTGTFLEPTTTHYIKPCRSACQVTESMYRVAIMRSNCYSLKRNSCWPVNVSLVLRSMASW